ncbi:hypothetical protein B0H17DRAFT_1328654 [Mycena rosella]|uniref:Uncharacterized protein n=1 Tax=Mycena rosella TaxID=1033263 RepID=A0AAD7DSV6_MYCRO|nr:hypothetical protein B0H17DRAFT_1328654 [Mycena rosella]
MCIRRQPPQQPRKQAELRHVVQPRFQCTSGTRVLPSSTPAGLHAKKAALRTPAFDRDTLLCDPPSARRDPASVRCGQESHGYESRRPRPRASLPPRSMCGAEYSPDAAPDAAHHCPVFFLRPRCGAGTVRPLHASPVCTVAVPSYIRAFLIFAFHPASAAHRGCGCSTPPSVYRTRSAPAPHPLRYVACVGLDPPCGSDERIAGWEDDPATTALASALTHLELELLLGNKTLLDCIRGRIAAGQPLRRVTARFSRAMEVDVVWELGRQFRRG